MSAFREDDIPGSEDMPRPPRIQLQNMPLHVIVRGNNKSPMFFGDADCEYFLRCLFNSATSACCDVHAYVLMTNHVHMLATPRLPSALSRMMQDTGRRYVENVNLIHGRTGTLFEGRFKAKPVPTMPYAMTALRYIEQNPVRAAMVARVEDYRWSSARHHLGLVTESAIVEHAVYLSLGATREERTAAYARHAASLLDPDALSLARARPKRGRPLKVQGRGLPSIDQPSRVAPASGDLAQGRPPGG